MLCIIVTVAIGLTTVSANFDHDSDPYAFKCNNMVEGGFSCENKGLGESLRFLATDL